MRDLDVVLVIAAFTFAAAWLTLHDPTRKDLRDLYRNERARRRWGR